MKMPSKKEALMKTLLYETAAVIHVIDKGAATVALVEVEKGATEVSKLETAFMKTNSITDAWWNNEGITKMFDGKACRSTSVGDMILLASGKKFKCEATGWSEV
tara:strand:- start:13 stop:324 length:312 start_codon:yes stop_codon:yes gene_type:complete